MALTLAEANRIVQAAITKAQEMNIKVSAASPPVTRLSASLVKTTKRPRSGLPVTRGESVGYDPCDR